MDVYVMSYKQKDAETKQQTLASHNKEWRTFCRHQGGDVQAETITPDKIAVYLVGYAAQGATAREVKTARAMLCANHDILHGGTAVESKPVALATVATKRMAPVEARKRPKPDHYFEINDLFERAEQLLQQHRDDLATLRVALSASLMIDIAGRGSDLASIPRELLRFADDEVELALVDTKTMVTPEVHRQRIRCFKRNRWWCTVCLLREWLDATKDWDIEPTMVVRTDAGVRRMRPLFCALPTKKAAPLKPLKAQTINARIRDEFFKPLGWHEAGYTPHNLRGAAASKLVNLGLDVVDVKKWARWSPKGNTLELFYLRGGPSAKAAAANRAKSIEQVLRTANAARASKDGSRRGVP